MLTYTFDYEGAEGYLVIDNTVNGKCFGGIRILEDVTLDEIKILARNMTLKYGFLGIKKGGAKAGIRIPRKNKVGRSKILKKFGNSIKPLLNESYWPGFDMGCTAEDLKDIMEGAGRNAKLILDNKSHVYTSWTIFECAKICLGIKDIRIDETSYAIEGFGNVGLSCAEIFSENKSKLVAISTSKGAIYKKEGLDVNKLRDLKEKYGDDLVNHYSDAKKISKDSLLTVDADILIPCARPNSINNKNVRRIKAKVISPGANGAINMLVDKILSRKGTLAVPDFISNSGGVLGSVLKNSKSDRHIKEYIEKDFHKKVEDILIQLVNKNMPLNETLSSLALQRFEKMKEEEEKRIPQKLMDMGLVFFNRVLNRLNQDKKIAAGFD